jgi:mono/diheme cytochrome c family protein
LRASAAASRPDDSEWLRCTPLRLFTRILLIALALVGGGAISVGAWLVGGGISARPEPGRMETVLARRVRSLAIPRSARERRNPVELTAQSLRSGMAHFADHCAGCHGNEGSGETTMGRGLYPRSPDMRKDATQALSDGELFYIIENGVRLTGMPAWGTGTPEGEQASWHLVQFVRHLPKLTDGELSDMSTMNPKSPDEWREEEEVRRFLEGGAGATTTPSPSRHEHPGDIR